MKKHKSRGLLVLGLVLLCITYITGISAEGKQKEPLRVGYFDYIGFIEKGSEGEFYGYGVDYLQELSKYTGWQYEYVYGSWSQCLSRLKNGEIDLLCTAQYTKERAEEYDYCEYASGLEYTVLYASQDNEELYFEDYAHLDGKKAGMMKSSFQNEIFYEFLQENALQMEPVYFNTNLEMEDALKVGLVDVIVSGSLDASPDLKPIAKMGVSPFYFITDKGNSELLTELNGAMRQLQIDRPFFNSHLYEKYYGSPENSLVGQTREEAEYINTVECLTVAYAENNFPVEYRDEETKAAAGMYVELLQKIAAYAGTQFEFVAAATPEEAVRMVNRGEADLAAAVYGTAALEEDYGLLATNAYTTAEIAVVTNRGSGAEEKEQLTAAISDKYINYRLYLQEEQPGWSVKTYHKAEACIEAVDVGKTDIALVDTLYLQSHSATAARENLVVASGMEIALPISIGLGKNQPEVLLSVLNKAILKVTQEDIKEARINCTQGTTLQLNLKAWLRANVLLIILMLTLCAGVTFIILERKKIYYRRLALTDDLTGAWNRNKFIKEAEKLLNNNRHKEYYLISADIDKFKYINDTYGYATGDEVLKEEAHRFSQIFGEKGIFARITADEFAGLIECSSFSDEKELLESLQAFEQAMHNYSNQYLRIQTKIGIYKIERRTDEIRITECIDRANIAKKRIKGNLNQAVVYFDKEIAKRSAMENEIEGRMEQALENGEFQVYYQPKYDLQTEQIVGAEALVRWLDPELGMLKPDLFIPLFEKNGFVIRLDFYVYERVFQNLQKWIQEGRKTVPISLNVSRVHLETPNFIADLVSLLKKYEIPVELIELELMESVFSEDEEAVKRVVLLLKNMGFRISIDDFGSGYSSLNLLKQIPADVLKIDRGFLEEIEESVKSKIIITQVVCMAKKINMHTLCEGVETKKQADFLREIHCDMAQGYLFSEPLPLEELEAKITRQS